MANKGQLAIRLALHGCTNRPFFHIVVMQKHKGRNSRIIEQIGSYDPLPNIHNEKLVAINYDRLNYWYTSGANLTKPIEKLLGLSGYFPIHPMTYIEAKRIRNTSQESTVTDSAHNTDPSLESS